MIDSSVIYAEEPASCIAIIVYTAAGEKQPTSMI